MPDRSPGLQRVVSVSGSGSVDPFLSALADVVAPALPSYWSDPAGWVDEFVDFRGSGLTGYQRSIMGELVEFGREAVRGPHGLGKTTTAALLILWFADTRERAGADWKIPTTASAWRQLTKYLWPEVHKWAKRLRWERLGRRPFRRTELMGLSLRLSHGEAFAAASNDHEKLEGAHADELLYVFDEGKAIPAATWDAAEGAFTGGGNVLALAISTPGEPQGRFYQIHKREAGYEDWHARHVSKDEVIAAGRMDARWAVQRSRQWGADSALYLNRVEGEFASSDEDGVIPLSWVEAAQERWRDFHADCDGKHHKCVLPTFTCVGVDPARSGPDKTVLATRYDTQVFELRKFSKEGTTQTSRRVEGVLEANGGGAVVDVIGIGAGVVDQLRDGQFAKRVMAFNASEKTSLRDRSGELGFVNKRAAAWWHLRERLDPDSSDEPILLPPDDDLVGDLCAPKWMVQTGGIRIESKEDIQKRIGRSTDSADAVIHAFWWDTQHHRVVYAPPEGFAQLSYWRGVA